MNQPIDPILAPQIEIIFPRILCVRHGEPYRDRWPKGYPFALAALEALLKEDAFFQAVNDPDVVVRNKKVEQQLDLKPACCRIGDLKVLELYILSEVGRFLKCLICGKVSLGTPISAAAPGGQVHKYNHVCFDCWLNRFKEAKAN